METNHPSSSLSMGSTYLKFALVFWCNEINVIHRKNIRKDKKQEKVKITV